MTVVEHAPAKVNLVLAVGPPRADGLHPLCSLFASIDLADLVTVEPADDADTVVCVGVEGDNLAARALASFRAEVPASGLPPLRVTIEKRIPVAAGLGGGSADAAAVLRAANAMAGSPLGAGQLRALGLALGADVPSQIEPTHAVVTGVGEEVEPLTLGPLPLVLVPQEQGLSTAAVYAELDRLRSAGQAPERGSLDPDPLRADDGAGPKELAPLLENDLEAAALSLRPELGEVLEALRRVGALAARITGSGPTAFGLFADDASAAGAARAIPDAMAVTTR